MVAKEVIKAGKRIKDIVRLRVRDHKTRTKTVAFSDSNPVPSVDYNVDVWKK